MGEGHAVFILNERWVYKQRKMTFDFVVQI
jgi:hypothetical protein